MLPPVIDLAALAAALAGQYQIERELGRGGMGVVFLARDVRLDRLVAIKTLPSHLAADAAVRDRFLREARTAGRLSHPNIVPVHRADELADFVFFVMGFVDGESLAQRIRRMGPLSPTALIPLLVDVALALGYAHSLGVVHRDVKGENILLDARGTRAMVTDFGIARVAQAAPLTQTGTALGTVAYMSPEQVAGEGIDGRSDLYAFGVLAFYALTGRFPFEHETPSAILLAHVTKAPPPLRSVAPHLPGVLASIVDRLLRKDPDTRFQDADELVDALRAAHAELPAEPAAVAADGILSATGANEVWRRAALLQEMTGQVVPPPEARLPATTRPPGSASAGYRVGEVVEAAAEVGIAPRYVERALAERAAARDGNAAGGTDAVRHGAAMSRRVHPLIGARSKIEWECVVDGELADADFEDVADEIRRSIGDLGNVNAIGRSVTWTSYGAVNPASQRKLQLSVSSRNGRTIIRGFEDLSHTTGGIYGGIVGGVGGSAGGIGFAITMGVTHSVLLAAPLFGGIVAGAYGLARTIFVFLSRKRERELRESVTRVAERVRQCIAEQRKDDGTLPAPARPRLGR